MKTKVFDCVEMKRRGAEAVSQRTAGMTFAQEVEYWKRCSEEFKRRQKRASPIIPTSRRPITQGEIADASDKD